MGGDERIPHVLVVDDQPDVARTISRALRGSAQVVIESSGPAALQRMERGERFDLIVCDVMMPGMTGTQVLERAKAHDADAANKWVFVTGGATQEERARVAATGVRCLNKPFRMTEIQNLLRGRAGS